MEATKFLTETKKVKLRLIKKARALFTDAKHPDAQLFGSSRIKYTLPRDRNGVFVNPFSSKEEQAWLEKSLDADLNIYKRENNFWTKYKITLDKNERTLDLSNPKDYLDYIVLRTLKLYIAPTGDRKNQTRTQVFELVEEQFEAQKESSRADKLRKAYMLFGKLEDKGKEEMLNFLKVYGEKVSADSKIEYIKGKINNIIEDNIDGFLALAQDQNFGLRLLIEQAVQAGVLVKTNREYVLPGGDKLAPEGLKSTIDVAIKYLSDKSNQDILNSIRQQVATAKD